MEGVGVRVGGGTGPEASSRVRDTELPGLETNRHETR